MNFRSARRTLTDGIVDSAVYRYFETIGRGKKIRERIDFYAGFITKEMLVFDIGANFPATEFKIFLKLGARVVAFEPQTKCARFLRRVFGANKEFTLENCALGAQMGEGVIHISNASPLSSLSEDWIREDNAQR